MAIDDVERFAFKREIACRVFAVGLVGAEVDTLALEVAVLVDDVAAESLMKRYCENLGAKRRTPVEARSGSVK